MAIKEIDWDSAIGRKVRIYRNLNNGRMSLQMKIDKSWKVQGHVINCVIQDVSFRVSESGRQRVVRDQCKNVHAWGEGLLLGEFDESIYAPIDLSYNPYANQTFVERGTDHSILHCKFLTVRENKVFVSPDAVGGSEASRLIGIPGGRRIKTVQPALVYPAFDAIAA